MPRGQPDYGITTETMVASGISDPGEAAARLGSINIYDRRGWTVWMDDFEAPALKWLSGDVAPDVPVRLVTTDSWMGAQSAYFSIPAASLGDSNLVKLFPLLRSGRVGFEFWVRGYTRTPGYFRARFHLADGSGFYQGDILIDMEANTVSIVTAIETKVIDTGSFHDYIALPFIPIKVVVDVDTDTYVRLLVGSREYDISAHSLVRIGPIGNRYIRAAFHLYPDTLEDTWAWLDNFILTQAEP